MLVVKNPPAKAGDIREESLIPGSGRPPGEGHDNTLQYFCLKNPMDRGACWATVQGLQRVGYDYSDLAGTNIARLMFLQVQTEISIYEKQCTV